MRFSKTVVKYRIGILVLALVLSVPAVLGMAGTRINYDMLDYLPEDMDTVIGQNELMDEFGKGAFSFLIIEDMPDKKKFIVISIKNISASPLNCNPDELTERFIRGDVSRTTEGSGLGLSIAKNLTEAQKGTFEIQLDGDLFKVILTFPKAKEEKKA